MGRAIKTTHTGQSEYVIWGQPRTVRTPGTFITREMIDDVEHECIKFDKIS